MKQGKTLSQLAAEIERQAEAKQDYLVNTEHASLTGRCDLLIPTDPKGYNSTILPASNVTHRQIGDRVGIPAKYYERMRQDAPDLLATNVNHWFSHNPERRMVRTMDGRARAFLSDRYNRIDNIDIAESVLPILGDMYAQGLEIVSTEITERRLYLKAVHHQIQAEPVVGDVVEAGVMVSNSEIGFGCFVVTPFIHRLVCLNGMVVNDAKFRRTHLGKRENREGLLVELSDETKQAQDKAILLEARDTISQAFDRRFFDRMVNQMGEAAGRKIEGNPAEAVEVLAKKIGTTEDEKGGVLRHLIEGGDLSHWGLVNAVTRTAQDVEDYDRATELEAMGGKVLDLPRTDWREIAEAA